MTIDILGSLSGARTERAAVPGDPAARPAVNRLSNAAQAAETVSAKAEPASPNELNDAVDKLNQSMQTRSQGLEFSIDEDSKRTIVKLVDLTTKEVVRQFPTEEALRISKSLDKFSGMLIDQKA